MNGSRNAIGSRSGNIQRFYSGLLLLCVLAASAWWIAAPHAKDAEAARESIVTLRHEGKRVIGREQSSLRRSLVVQILCRANGGSALRSPRYRAGRFGEIDQYTAADYMPHRESEHAAGRGAQCRRVLSAIGPADIAKAVGDAALALAAASGIVISIANAEGGASYAPL